MDTKTAPDENSTSAIFFIEIVLFGREVIILSNLLVLQPHMQPIFRTRKGTLLSAFCVMVLFAYANNLTLLAQTITL